MKTIFTLLFVWQVVSVFGQFQVGHRTITFNDPSRTGGFGSGGGPGRQIQTEIYYPSTAAGDNTPLANGDFPVIVFGHGFAMAWDAYSNIWQRYAAMGYILAFPRTEGGLIPGPSHNDFGLDLKLVGDRMLAEDNLASSPFFEKINGNVGIMGHSMGGGASMLGSANNSAIKTVVGLAPAETDPSAIAAAANVDVPALIFSGGQDGVTPPDEHHLPIYNSLASAKKTFVNIVGGAHCYFANSNFNCDFGEGTSSSGISITRAEQQTRTYSLLDPWLDYTLRGNCEAYEAFVNELDDSPSTLATQTTCVLNSVPVINESGSVLTSSISAVSYQWYLYGNAILGANSQSYTASSSGDYTVEVTFADGCAEISAPFTVSGLGLINDLSMDLYLSPNPTSGIVSVNNVSGKMIKAEVFDHSGKLLSFQMINNRIDMTSYQPGIYFIRIAGVNHRLIRY
jgi:dienelactone hydrolase